MGIFSDGFFSDVLTSLSNSLFSETGDEIS
jgi:hypothetical protein